MKTASILIVASIILSCNSSDNSSEKNNYTDGSEETDPSLQPSHIFRSLDSQLTGIDFVNTITQSPEVNIFSYEYLFNGGGVASADFNNDNLPDLLFTGNQVPNRIFINKGDLKFEDATEKAGINITNPDGKPSWHSGVAVADVNQDGWLDIYICRSGPGNVFTRPTNLLFINNGNMTFTERSKEYGVDDSGYSTGAAFLDYDKDGDVDLFVLNHFTIFNARVPEEVIRRELPERSSQLYRNDNGKFVKVTSDLGMLKYAYGLGVTASDLNNDGWTDLYVSNDFAQPNVMWINNGDGTFSDEIKTHLGHTAYFSMGCDVNDFNNDGHPDIMAVDMASRDHLTAKTFMASMNTQEFKVMTEVYGQIPQYMFNELQLNNGNGRFSDIAHLAGIAKTEWSWAPLFADFDNDGFKDLIVTNGFKQNVLDNDLKLRIKARQEELKGKMMSDEERFEWVAQAPEYKTINYYFRNNGDLTFKNMSSEWLVNPPGLSNGAVYTDLDRDGDLDLVINNIDENVTVLENIHKGMSFFQLELRSRENRFASLLNAKVFLYNKGGMQFQEFTPYRGYQSSVEPLIHFGLGKEGVVDSVVIRWTNGKEQSIRNPKPNQRITVFLEDASTPRPAPATVPAYYVEEAAGRGLQFVHQKVDFDDFAREVLLPHKISSVGGCAAVADINSDGLDDIYFGGSLLQEAGLFVQNKNGGFSRVKTPAFEKDKNYNDLGCMFFDADGDGDFDLYVCSGGSGRIEGNTAYNQDRLYMNNNGTFERNKKFPVIKSSTQAVVSFDFDGDGDLDLFVGGRNVPGRYPETPNSYLLKNDGKGNFTDITKQAAPELEFPGLVTDVIAEDFNGDGKTDLIICGEWMAISFFQNTGKSFTNVTSKIGSPELTGWWYSLTSVDWDGDGDNDLIAGNIGGNNKFQPSTEKPLKVLLNDFDNNGTPDMYLCTKYKGKEVPVRGRECSSQQMPFILDKFKTYRSFANADINEILGKQAIENALSKQAVEFKHVVLINDKGTYKKAEFLDNRLQVAPLRDAVKINSDKGEWLVMGGNLKDSEVETTPYDAGIGYLLSRQSGKWAPEHVSSSGFYIPGDVRQIKPVRLSGGKTALVVVNYGGAAQLFVPSGSVTKGKIASR
jgi:enediyne biosynthesis protein E4